MKRSKRDKSGSMSDIVNVPDQEFLNAYETLNLDSCTWPVNMYRVQALSNEKTDHKNRGKLRNIMWDLRRKNGEQCVGYGFIIDTDKNTVITPEAWNLPDQSNFQGYRIKKVSSFDAKSTNPDHKNIILSILQESIKQHFKQGYSDELGVLWQDFNDFCQIPANSIMRNGIIFCRKFNASVEHLRNNRWVIQVSVTARMVDSRTFSDYYQASEVQQLNHMIQAKQTNRLTRKNQPPSVRVLSSYNNTIGVVDLDNPHEIYTDSLLEPAEQQAMSNKMICCSKFKQQSSNIPSNQIRLILDSQLTSKTHQETLIAPHERFRWYNALRNFLHDFNAYDHSIQLSEQPVNIASFDEARILPPSIWVKGSKNKPFKLSKPKEFNRRSLENRTKKRSQLIRDNGYLEQRFINPLLAYPDQFGEERAIRLQKDLNDLVKRQGLDFRFSTSISFNDINAIEEEMYRNEHDALLAVLPEPKRSVYTNSDTHEKIKRKIQAPSQCIHIDNTLPSNWLKYPSQDLKELNHKLFRRITNNYQQCILGLLVKHHWVPFVPADRFHYNVHVGIDVGGRHNTHVMSCIGYGFNRPDEGLAFLPQKIHVEVQQAEPILADYLYDGLLSHFEELRTRLSKANFEVDYNKVIFFRDGEYRGSINTWNETDALKRLYQTLLERKWIHSDAIWTAVEVSKRAGHWRILRQHNQQIYNPLVGYVSYPFENPNHALVCTSGSPYLTQGTASPILVKIHDIGGRAKREEVIRDLIWEADMSFTKIDTGLSLPWVLHVANKGALQLAKSYYITGVTV